MGTVAALERTSKRFGQVQALQEVDLEVRRGELLALLGPNGAGKTTAISLLLGLRRPDEGRVELFGRDPRDPKARLQVGVTPQEIGFPPLLKVREVVALVGAHYPSPMPARSLLSRFGLLELEHRQTGGLSGGQKRRLAVALAFAGNPQAVFLDEPTTGLDVEARRGVWQAVRGYVEEGGTVLLTTHYLEEAEALATRVVVLHEGRVVAEGSVEEIKARVGVKRVRFQAPELPSLPGVVKAETQNGTHTLYTPEADRLVRTLVEEGIPFRSLEVLPVSLEEAFLVLTGKGGVA